MKERILFFNPILLKEDFVKGVKKRLTYDRNKVVLLKELLTKTKSQLILIWFSLQDEKDLELIPFLKNCDITPVDYIPSDEYLYLKYKAKSPQDYDFERLKHQDAVKNYPKENLDFFIVDTQFNCCGDRSAVLGRNCFTQKSLETIISRFR